jgi:anti-sigma factor RsiW
VWPASSMLTCQQLVELVSDYLDGCLDPPTRERFEAHVAVCPGCREYVDQLRHTVRALGRLQEDALSAAARDELLRAFAGWRG